MTRQVSGWCRSVAMLLALASVTAGHARAEADVLAPFALKVKDVITRLRVMSVFVMPGERLTIDAVGPTRRARFALETKHGALVTKTFDRWEWRAPVEPGRYRLKIAQLDSDADIDLSAFVMVPASRVRDGWLNGYHIGEYPPAARTGNPTYHPPRGFIEVTDDNKDAHLTPRFRLQQFLCKQEATFPKYVVLRERLLVTLERVIDDLSASGIDADRLYVMSGYRTPFYNRAIGNVTFSMHQFGGAADVFVDEDGNGLMDDLNRDRQIDRTDAVVLHDVVERLVRHEPGLIGGLGVYGGTNAHGPFVHVDVRPGHARW